MPLPLIAIIGRTNVGKSALFNRLAREKRAVVEDIPGVTRDRLYAQVSLDEHPVMLVDTGGLVGAESDELIGQVQEQAALALAEADVLILLVDAQEGLTLLDGEVARVARRSGKPIVLVANKVDSGHEDAEQFAELSLGVPLPVSALHNKGVAELEDAILEVLPEGEAAALPEDSVGITVLGRPNVGKSALVNALLGQPRMIVSEVAGTTRDAVDTVLTWAGTDYVLVDTPGLRRRGKRSQGLEYYSSLRTLRALQTAEIAIVVFDAEEGFTQQDGAIALEVHNSGRCLMVVANKWDLVTAQAFEEEEMSPPQRQRAERLLREDFERIARARLPFAAQAPFLFTCALTGEGLPEILPLARSLHEQYHRRIETGPLNRALAEAAQTHAPPSRGGRQLKLRYLTQAETAPPTFVLFVNDLSLMHFSYKRFLLNFLRQKFNLESIPLELRVRRSSGREGK